MIISYRIPITTLKTSTNKIYAGTHWSKRKTLKDSILDYAAGFCRPVQSVESYPVEIRYRFTFKSRVLDTLNCAYMAKMFEDAFRAIGVIEDDDPKYVARSIIEVVSTPKSKTKEKGRKDEDWLEIFIKSINKLN